MESVDNYVDNLQNRLWITFLQGSYFRFKAFFVLFFCRACGKLETLKPLKFQWFHGFVSRQILYSKSQGIIHPFTEMPLYGSYLTYDGRLYISSGYNMVGFGGAGDLRRHRGRAETDAKQDGGRLVINQTS